MPDTDMEVQEAEDSEISSDSLETVADSDISESDERGNDGAEDIQEMLQNLDLSESTR